MAIAPKPRGNIIDYFENNNRDLSKNNGYWKSLCVTNDDTRDLHISLNGMTFKIKAGETFDDDFEDFNYISIGVLGSNALYRLWLRE